MTDYKKAAAVWQRPDDDFRYANIELKIGGFPLISTPPSYVKEITLATSESNPEHMLTVEVFDATWLTVAGMLGKGVDKVNKVIPIEVKFGWPFPDGQIGWLSGRLWTLKYQIAPEGITYTLQGMVGHSPDTSQYKDWATQQYTGCASDVAAKFYEMFYKHTSEREPCIEPSGDKPKTHQVDIKKHGTPELFLRYLASQATPKNRVVPQGLTEGEAVGGNNYIFKMDVDGTFTFCSSNYKMDLYLKDTNPLLVTYPYPGRGNPAIQLDFAEVEWSNLSLLAGGMDPNNPNAEQSRFTLGDADGVPVPVRMIPGDMDRWIHRLQETQLNMSRRMFTADLVTIGNPYIFYHCPIDIRVVTQEIQTRHIDMHLNGIYRAESVIQAVAGDSYVTRCHLKRFSDLEAEKK
jgi:hypothetical protein